MSLITRCPACATMFKVVPDQLRISEGWVRCGHCAEVFDAAANMQQEAIPPLVPPAGAGVAPGPSAMPAVAAPMPHAASPPSQAPAPGPARPQWTAPAFQPPPPDSQGAASSLPENQVNSDLHRPPSGEQGRDPVLPPDSMPPSFESSLPPMPGEATGRPPAPDPFKDSRDGAESSSLTESTLESVSFVREARRKAFWRRPAVRVMMSLVVLLLLAVLGLQVAVHERDRIAAIEPRARPWLEQLCLHLQCAIEPLREIESIVIDSSSFTKLRADTYRLSLTLRNNASVPLAMPAIELALTDAADQPVVRRVLTPADLGAGAPGRTPVIGPGAEWSGNYPLGVNGNSSRIVGYRLLAFYP